MHNPSPHFILTIDAKEDLAAIARYTEQKWGREQAMRYAAKLDAKFHAIAENDVSAKAILPNHPLVQICRAEHHYIVYTRTAPDKEPIILAVLHERMDVVARVSALISE